MRLLIYAVPLAAALFAAPLALADADLTARNGGISIALAKEALEHAKKGEFELARGLYGRAYDLAPSTALLFNLALAELASGEELSAIRHFRRYLTERDAEASKIAIIKSDLLPKAYAVTGHIVLEHVPSTADIAVDGTGIEAFGDASERIADVSAGDRTLVATTPDATYTAHVTVGKGQRVAAVFERKEEPQKLAPPGPVASRPSGDVPTSAAARPDAQSYWTAQRKVSFTIFAGAVVAQGASIFFLVDGANARSRVSSLALDTQGKCGGAALSSTGGCSDLANARERVDRDNVGWVASMVTGGALTLVSVVVFKLLEPRKAPSAAPQSVLVSPTFDVMSGRAGLVGTF